MKITVEKPGAARTQLSPNPPPPSDLPGNSDFPRKPPRRRTKALGAGVRLKRETGAPSVKRSSRPETPLLKWKFNEGCGEYKSAEEDKSAGEAFRKCRRRTRSVISARKLAAGIWRLRLPDFDTNAGRRVGLQSGVDHLGGAIHIHHVHGSPSMDLVHSPESVSGPKHGLLYKFEPFFQFPNSAMEGATKWDPHGWKASTEPNQIFTQPNYPEHRTIPSTVIPALEAELDQARTRINELETERRSSKKKLEQFLRKLSEERAAWRSREHEKVRAIIDDMKSDLTREKKSRQRLEMVNSKLVNDLADAKLSAKRYMQEYEKERKARELIEEVCDELAKEISEDKAEAKALNRESTRLVEEVEEERKMLQMAEVWREERVQMKIVDAKVMLEEKYVQMNELIAGLESLLGSRNSNSDSTSEEIKKAEFLVQVARSVSMQDVRELTYEPPNPDDIFSVFGDVVNFDGESNEREAGPCNNEHSPDSRASKIHTVSPEVKMLIEGQCRARSHCGHSNMYMDRSRELEEDASEWETVSHTDDQGSSYSPDRASNVSRNRAEMSEADSVKMRLVRRVSSASKQWRSYPNNGDNNYKIVALDGKNGRLSNGRISSGTMVSLDHHGLSPRDLSGQWSSPDSANPHLNRAMKGCIEWPRSVQKNSLKSRLLEARMESQKVQLRQVLKQKF
ncbi:hypothetical protein CASFOL_014933 [Castilleja foliolosa]|uniref:Uncharacterized protein n=1 Tax=Castilleja foliolosa TaxID=1961234 RepID=A0ABD3DCB5_9LAMI